MTKQEFAALHTGSEPLVLFNVWDAGSAQAVAAAGAKAIATGSLSLAGAQGYEDGESIPFAKLLEAVSRIASATDLPLSVDIETGYARDLASLEHNARQLRDAGAIGCNLEDRLLDHEGLRDASDQAVRIAVLDAAGLFVNARTDLFLSELMAGADPNRTELVKEAVKRACVYRVAGAGCLFAPGLSDPALIRDLCRRAGMPINIMRLPGMVPNKELHALGVARISYGPGPWRDAMAGVAEAAKAAFAS